MQDKDLVQNNEKSNTDNLENKDAEKTAEDGVVYVVNDDGTAFDASERTYVAVEGLEGEIGSEDSSTDNNTKDE